MKGQVSIEFFIYFAASVLALAVIGPSVTEKQVQSFQYREAVQMQAVAEKVSYELERAETDLNYSEKVTLPREIYGSPYSVDVKQGFVTVDGENRNVTVTTLYTGDQETLKSTNTPFKVINNGTVHIR